MGCYCIPLRPDSSKTDEGWDNAQGPISFSRPKGTLQWYSRDKFPCITGTAILMNCKGSLRLHTQFRLRLYKKRPYVGEGIFPGLCISPTTGDCSYLMTTNQYDIASQTLYTYITVKYQTPCCVYLAEYQIQMKATTSKDSILSEWNDTQCKHAWNHIWLNSELWTMIIEL